MARYTLNQVSRAIEKAKTQLIKKARTYGIVENFGQQSADKIKEKYCPSNWYDFYPNRDIALKAERQVQGFYDWTSTFSLWDLQHNRYYLQ